MLIVLVAMGVDLISGWRKATVRKEAHRSYLFSRSLTKFLQYNGILLVGTCIDALLHFGLYMFIEANYCIPVVELLMAVVLCGVEMWSVWEKAEDKVRHRSTVIVQTGAKGVAQILDNDALSTALTAAIGEALKVYLKPRGAAQPAETEHVEHEADENVNYE